MKDYLKKLLKKLNERKAELDSAIIEAETKEERAEIGKTLKTIKEEIAEAEEQLAAVEAAEEGEGEEGEGEEGEGERKFRIGKALDMRNTQKDREKRAKEFAKTHRMSISVEEAAEAIESRSVLVSSGDIATPTAVHGINDALGEVSTILDVVNVVNAEGMGSDKVAYEKAGSTAAVQTEGQTYNESDPTFDFVEITPQTVAVLSYISKQVRKQSPLLYQQKVMNAALKALKVKAANIVITKMLASQLLDSTMEALEAIDETTLRKIALAYGGENCILGNAELILCKKDLIKFGEVRGTNEKGAVYEITPAGNGTTGTIKDGGLTVRYRLSTITEGTMLYGQPLGFQLDLFSPYEVNVSDDYKFGQGLLAISGDVQLGGEIVVDKGFVQVTIGE